MNFRQKLSKYPFIKFFTSIKLTVLCLFLLFILTLFGTIAQINEGLYQAQLRYFQSFFFLIFGFLPFPGAQSVMWVLFINLVCVALIRFVYKWHRVGILLIHSGLMLFLISGYMTLHLAQESHLTLKEGQAANFSTAYHNWEIAVWPATEQPNNQTIKRDVTSFDADFLKIDNRVKLDPLGFQLTVKEYYKNCRAYIDKSKNNVLNTVGITRLESAALIKEPEKNIPGGMFRIETADHHSFDVLLYGGQTEATTIVVGKKRYHLILRLKHYPMPLMLRLKEFEKEIHPGTDTPRSFQSVVEIQTDNVWREKLISMNEPLRYKDFTFYQASFAVDQMGGKMSTLAVVKNAGRLMPYISTFVTVLGLITHFCLIAYQSKNKTKQT